ncbi:hypothetical protein ACVBEQ_21365 [Nakamurella sp. GG22]
MSRTAGKPEQDRQGDPPAGAAGQPAAQDSKRENRDEVRYGTPGACDKAKAAGNRDK